LTSTAGRFAAGFESGAILIHLAEKSGGFMPGSRTGRKECLEWLFRQVGNLGPMADQLSHFVNHARSVQDGDHRYAHRRYAGECNRCPGVRERRLEGRAFILDDYSIADMISWPWALIAMPLGQFTHLPASAPTPYSAPSTHSTGRPAHESALQLLALLFPRPGELRVAQ
jgi:glutathione S-transferase